MIIQAIIKGNKVSAVVDTECSGIILNQSNHKRLNLVADDEVEMTLTSAVDTVKKKRKIF